MHIAWAKLGQADAGDNEVKLMTKLAPEWVRTSDPVIGSPARYRWTTAPASFHTVEAVYVGKLFHRNPHTKYLSTINHVDRYNSKVDDVNIFLDSVAKTLKSDFHSQPQG